MDLADAWVFPYTDFGEARGILDAPVLRAVVHARAPGTLATVAAILDSGGPITVVSPAFLRLSSDRAPSLGTASIRLGGRRYEAPLVELSLAIHRSASTESASIAWTSNVAVLDPWPHASAAVIFGHIGFFDRFTVTFGPDGFAVEAGPVVGDRFSR